MLERKIGIYLGYAILILSLVSCSKKYDKNENTGYKEIRLACLSTPIEMSMIKDRVKKFEDENPDVKIKTEFNDPNNFYLKILTEFAGNVSPDVIFLWDSLIPIFAEKEVLLDLNPFIEKYGVDLEDFYPQAVNYGKWEGKQYLIPRETGNMALCYNKTLFDREKLSYPDDDWTWDDFIKAVKELTKDIDGDEKIDQYGFWGVRPFFTWGYFVIQNGGHILSEDKKKCLLDSQEAIEAFKFAKSIQKVTGADEQDVQGSLSLGQMFISGRVAMMYSFRDMASELIKVKSLRFGFSLLPKGKIMANHGGMGGYGMSKSAKNPEGCLKLIKFLCNIENQRILAEKTGAVPSRKSCKEYWLSLYPKEININAFIDGMPYSGTEFLIPRWNETIYYAQREADKFFQIDSDITAEDVCKKMTQAMDTVLLDKK